MQKLNFKRLFRIEMGSVFLVLFGGILLLNPDFGSAALASILGWVLVGGGAVGLLIGFLCWPGLGLTELIGSVILLGGGIYLLRNPLVLASAVGMLLGLLLICQGFSALWDALQLKRFGGHPRLSLILGLGMGVLGIYLILSPLATSRFVMTAAGLVMVACGITNLISHYRAKKFITNSRKKIIGNTDTPDIVDADE
jgi:uncharacterized membrane protein HdeD (DUF308 family)